LHRSCSYHCSDFPPRSTVRSIPLRLHFRFLDVTAFSAVVLCILFGLPFLWCDVWYMMHSLFVPCRLPHLLFCCLGGLPATCVQAVLQCRLPPAWVEPPGCTQVPCHSAAPACCLLFSCHSGVPFPMHRYLPFLHLAVLPGWSTLFCCVLSTGYHSTYCLHLFYYNTIWSDTMPAYLFCSQCSFVPAISAFPTGILVVLPPPILRPAFCSGGAGTGDLELPGLLFYLFCLPLGLPF